ncbi:substrate-binding domain-containing protein [Rubritalea tangerina]|uniref:Substrate-binding domain-containing protein n=2 Tax=Rubritalea tangerina TaxID=430798 RepID=A0ABW4ZAQ7_9BACT
MDEKNAILNRWEQIANIVICQIESKKWQHTLPGVNALSKEYHVNHKTVRKALLHIENRGFIAPPEGRKPRKIIDAKHHPKPQRSHPRRLLILSNKAEDIDRTTQKIFDGLKTLWAKKFEDTQAVAVDFMQYIRPTQYLKRLLKLHSADALVILNAHSEWSNAANQLLPTYLLGGWVPKKGAYSISGPAQSLSYEALVQKLTSIGHQRILCAMMHCIDEEKELITNVYKNHLNEQHLLGRCHDYVVRVKYETPESWMAMWQRQIPRLQPTAVIVENETHLLSLYSYCHLHQISIPDDLSVACVCDSDILDYLTPRPVRQVYPLEETLRHFQQWINHGLTPIGKKILADDFTHGDSIAPPKNLLNNSD